MNSGWMRAALVDDFRSERWKFEGRVSEQKGDFCDSATGRKGRKKGPVVHQILISNEGWRLLGPHNGPSLALANQLG